MPTVKELVIKDIQNQTENLYVVHYGDAFNGVEEDQMLLKYLHSLSSSANYLQTLIEREMRQKNEA